MLHRLGGTLTFKLFALICLIVSIFHVFFQANVIKKTQQHDEKGHYQMAHQNNDETPKDNID